ncbi:CGNR zinc finger domain-containing protein [Streptomyces sp. NPDC051917]|uniref:CGNR zinc finger domain-containing protein n=1 Tax=Streptomyces sp. NPDC051917 TaxID=3154754 RepID=UPI003452441D
MDSTVHVGLGDDPALEFLNTAAAPALRRRSELIGSGPSYLAWLGRTELLAATDLESAREVFPPDELDAAASAARDLREILRSAVAVWAGDRLSPVDPFVVARLNTVLAAGGRYTQLHVKREVAELRNRHYWVSTGQLLLPVAQAWACLLTGGDPRLVRMCVGCTIWFYDRTKSHRRRWCSMALCGNRAKVRRHRQLSAPQGGQARPRPSGSPSTGYPVHDVSRTAETR